ncbi:MAG: OPT/YSL family transporter [Sandaracinaceae bacterium]|jgi:OPT family oligopeptide transporter|nr:OPT/YSL family transporter [Sandaracinaceae bacterium]
MAAPTTDSSSTASGTPEGLPDLSQLPEEERDKAWLKHYYAGDGTPQLTMRAVVMGGLLGALMAVSNLYTTLKLGWAFGVAITASVLSFTIWNTFVVMGLAKSRMTILENNCMQSTASAAGYSTGGTLATAVGAMLLITGDAARLPWLPVAFWVGLTALLGVFLAIPMKRQMINNEQLPFPSGIAAAETLRSLYAAGQESVLKARALVIALVVGIASAFMRDVMGWIPSSIPFDFTIFEAHGRTIRGGQMGGLAFEPGLLLIAAGMIVGLRVSTWMLIGSSLAYFVLIPWAAGQPDWSAEGVTFLGHVEAILGDDGGIAMIRVTKWSLWLGTAILVASGLTSFAMSWRTILRAVQKATSAKGGKDGEAAKDADPVGHLEVPVQWFAWGMAPITLGLVLVCWLSLDIAPWLGVVSVGLSFFLALVACRATGETDTTPIGAMGKITQFTYAILAPGNTTVNLMTAGITAGSAGSAADLLTDLKSGYLLGANPRQQFLAQLVGVVFGVPAVIAAWYMLVPDQAHLEAFNSPATGMWAAVARALSGGVETIPETARMAIIVGAIAGTALSLAESMAPKHIRPWVPSSMGLGLAFVVPFQNSFSFFLGAVIALIWQRVSPKSAERYIIPIASGVVAGESLLSAGNAMWSAASDLIFGGGGGESGGGH